MKKLISIILLTAFLCSLYSSSSGNRNAPVIAYDKLIYRMESGVPLQFDNSYGMPVIIDPVNGITTSVCMDPLCMHDTDECRGDERQKEV